MYIFKIINNMELIYLNKKLDTNLEHELMSENEFNAK
jgi:hypothetical protein